LRLYVDKSYGVTFPGKNLVIIVELNVTVTLAASRGRGYCSAGAIWGVTLPSSCTNNFWNRYL